jgi:hypothetical protein
MTAITYGDYLIDSGYYDITPEQEREMEQIDYNEPIDDAGNVVGDGLKARIAELEALLAQSRQEPALSEKTTQTSDTDIKPVAWITAAGLNNWLKGDGPENHVLLRTGNDMRVPLYTEAGRALLSAKGGET